MAILKTTIVSNNVTVEQDVQFALNSTINGNQILHKGNLTAANFPQFVGYTGSAGAAGSGGISGIAGDGGVAGIKGDTGTVGDNSTDTGFTGSTGYTGSLGYTGSFGLNGINGATGDRSYTGSRGAVGYTGSQGYTGSKGGAGSRGDLGAAGPTGYQGSQGYTGSKGPIGATGDRGSTGAVGDPGTGGIAGGPGSRGDTGSTGTRGATGDTGPIGATGATGNQGATGTTGPTGYAGSQGYTGSAGSTGFTGSVGYTGSIGFTGSQGYTGSLIDTTGAGITMTDVLSFNCNLHPNSNALRNIGSASTNRYANFYVRDTYATTNTTNSNIDIKTDISKISSPLVNFNQEMMDEYSIPIKEGAFEKLVDLFSRLNFYHFTYKGDESAGVVLGVIIEEIEDILSDSPEVLRWFVQVNSEPIVDENNQETGEYREVKYLRFDNFNTLRTVVMQHTYYELLELERKNSLIEEYISSRRSAA